MPPLLSEFHLRPENVVARAGDMATMSCLYDEDGVMIITWDKDTTSIIPGTTCDCSIVGNGNLKFNNVSLGDVAEYTCNVMTDFGSRKACSALLGLAGELALGCVTWAPGVPYLARGKWGMFGVSLEGREGGWLGCRKVVPQ